MAAQATVGRLRNRSSTQLQWSVWRFKFLLAPTLLALSAIGFDETACQVTLTVSMVPELVSVEYAEDSPPITCMYTLTAVRHGELFSNLTMSKTKQLSAADASRGSTATNAETAKGLPDINGSDSKRHSGHAASNEVAAEDRDDYDSENAENDDSDEMYDAENSSVVASARDSYDIHRVPSITKITSTLALQETPDVVNLKLFDYNVDGFVRIWNEPLERLRRGPLNVTFVVRDVRQSGKFRCELTALSARPAFAVGYVYVKTAKRCDIRQQRRRRPSSSSCSQHLRCLDGRYVCCLGRRHVKRDADDERKRDCEPVVPEDRCQLHDPGDDWQCRVSRRTVMLPYEEDELARSETAPQRDNARTITFDNRTSFTSRLEERSCYSCGGRGNVEPSSRFMTALVVTFLVLVSGAMSVVGAAILYDWWKRRQDLNELEREHTEQNRDAVDSEALRRVAEDRPPSYIDTRKSDLHLAGVPPPSYEDVFKAAAGGYEISEGGDADDDDNNNCSKPTLHVQRQQQQQRQRQAAPLRRQQPSDTAAPYAVSTPRLAVIGGSVLSLETIQERRISL